MSKMTWIMIAIGVVVGLTVLVCLFPPVSLVANRAQEIESVTVTFDPTGEGQVITLYDDTAQDVHDRLLQMSAKARRFPSHKNAQTADPHYEISIVYANGESIEVRSSENPAYIYRFLSSRGFGGDQGYVYAVNEEFADYILSLQE